MNGSRELTIPNRVRSASAMTGKCQKNRSQVKFISTYREAQKYAAGMTSRAISAGRLLTFRNAHIKCVDCGNKAYHYEHRSYNHPEIVEPVCRKCNRKRGKALFDPTQPIVETEYAYKLQNVGGPRCPNCDSNQVYFRVKTEDFLCRSCGQPFTRETPQNPGIEPENERETR